MTDVSVSDTKPYQIEDVTGMTVSDTKPYQIEDVTGVTAVSYTHLTLPTRR